MDITLHFHQSQSICCQSLWPMMIPEYIINGISSSTRKMLAKTDVGPLNSPVTINVHRKIYMYMQKWWRSISQILFFLVVLLSCATIVWSIVAFLLPEERREEAAIRKNWPSINLKRIVLDSRVHYHQKNKVPTVELTHFSYFGVNFTSNTLCHFQIL